MPKWFKADRCFRYASEPSFVGDTEQLSWQVFLLYQQLPDMWHKSSWRWGVGLWVWDPWGNHLEEVEGKLGAVGSPVAAIWLHLKCGLDRTVWGNLSAPPDLHLYLPFLWQFRRRKPLFMWEFRHMNEENYKCTVCKKLLCNLMVHLQPSAN